MDKKEIVIPRHSSLSVGYLNSQRNKSNFGKVVSEYSRVYNNCMKNENCTLEALELEKFKGLNAEQSFYLYMIIMNEQSGDCFYKSDEAISFRNLDLDGVEVTDLLD